MKEKGNKNFPCYLSADGKANNPLKKKGSEEFSLSLPIG
jgi:hypothetical protein